MNNLIAMLQAIGFSAMFVSTYSGELSELIS